MGYFAIGPTIWLCTSMAPAGMSDSRLAANALRVRNEAADTAASVPNSRRFRFMLPSSGAEQRGLAFLDPARRLVISEGQLQTGKLGLIAADDLHSHRQTACAEAHRHVQRRQAAHADERTDLHP